MVIYKKISKRTLSLLLLVLICFNTFYFDYKRADAIFVPVVEGGIALADALLYLAGLCGVAFTADYIATHPLTDERKQELVDNFNDECERQNINQQTRDKWTRELVKGTLDKASACWKAFTTSISSSHEYEYYSGTDANGKYSAQSACSAFNKTFTYGNNGEYTSTFNASNISNFSSLPSNSRANFVKITSSMSGEYCYVNVYLFSSYGEVIHVKPDGSTYFKASNNDYGHQKGYTYSVRGTEYCFSAIRGGKFSYNTYYQDTLVIKDNPGIMNNNDISYMYSCGLVYEYDNPNTILNSAKRTSARFRSRPQLRDRGYFDGSSSLADGNVNIINPGATSIDDPVSINWDNISVVGDVGAGGISGTQEGEKVISNSYEKLWEKVANGEITWEQFIEALQDGVGVIATERVPAAELPGDDTLDYVDEVVVPANPDLPEEKDKVDDIIQNNQAKGDGLTFDLRKFFPFCIPWDLYNLFSYLNAPAEAPKFEIPVPAYDNSGHLTMENTITVDLSIFDSVALVFRVCIFIIFCLGLILITRSLIRG